MQPKSWEICIIQQKILGLQAQETASQVTLRKLLREKGAGEKPGYTDVLQQRAGSLNANFFFFNKLQKTIYPKLKNLVVFLCMRLVQAMVFPVVMCGYESWTIEKVERQRNDAFELWCWRRLLSPLDCKEIQTVYLKGNQF